MCVGMAEAPLESADVNHAVEQEPLLSKPPEKPLNMSAGAAKLRTWLNKSLSIRMFDGRVLVGVFLCSDRDANVILGSCTEYLPMENYEDGTMDEPRMLGLVMVPGKHIQSVALDQSQCNHDDDDIYANLTKDISPDDVT